MSKEIQTTAEAAEEAVLLEAYAVKVNADGEPVAENQQLPAAVSGRPLEQKSPAEWAYERVVLYIQEFEKQLDGDQEVGLGFAGSEVGTLHIQGMGYFAPDMITFYGVDPSGAKMQLVQHVSQLSVMLIASPKEDANREANRIGFKLASKLDKKGKS
ncbi:MAG: hypothetical protein GY952_20935 [Rhodobacteraceae bacterium]|nr:hypothetical protein [Paracoccaceae bacterium]